MGTEIWKPKKDYEGLYEVSNFGNIMSLNYRNTGKSKLLKPIKDKNGYLNVGLYKDGEKKWFLVHRLIAETFIPNPENLPHINHKDEDKTNNRADNLEWCTPKNNCNYGTRNERVGKAMTNGKLSKPVLQLSLTGDLIREWLSTMECERNGFDHGNVAACCRGERNSAYGFIWRYK